MNLELESWKIRESCMRYNYKKMNYILTSSTMQYFLHFVLLSGAFFIIYLFDNLLDYSVTLLASCPTAVSGQRLQCQAGVNILLKCGRKYVWSLRSSLPAKYSARLARCAGVSPAVITSSRPSNAQVNAEVRLKTESIFIKICLRIFFDFYTSCLIALFVNYHSLVYINLSTIHNLI